MPDGVEVTYDESRRITWYSPEMNSWQEFKLRAIPSLAVAEDGARKVVLTIEVKDPPKGRPTSLQLTTEEGPWSVPIADSDAIRTHDSGCRVTQTIHLQNQLSLLQKIAGVTRAEMVLAGYRNAVRHRMSGDDLAVFKKILDLWNAPRLPSAPEAQVKRKRADDALVAGVGNVKNPEIIKSSKVLPRFPKFAEGKKVLGRVVLQAVVRKDGSVGDVEVLQGAGGDCGFEQSAIEAVRQWRYKPALKDGEPVDVYFTIVVDFTFGDYQMAK